MRLAFVFLCSALAAIAFSLFLVTPANAESVFDRYFAGSHLNFDVSDDSITDTAKFEAELELRYRNQDISAFARLTNDRPFGFQTEPFSLEKRGFEYRFGDWKLDGGDYSLVYGRGLALNAIEERGVDRDAQLDGAMLKGSLGSANVTAFWGDHKSDRVDFYISGVNTDNRGPADRLFGGRIDYSLNHANVGLGWLNADMTRNEHPLSTSITEFNGSWNPGDFSLYYETAWFNRPEPGGSEESMDGRGQLTEALYAAGGFSLSGAWVRYDKASFDYATAPSLKRPDIDNASSHPDDETGYRFESRYSPRTWHGGALRGTYASLNGIERKDQEFRDLFVEWTSSPMKDWSGSLSYDHISGYLLYYGSIDGKDENYRFTLDGPCPLMGTLHLQGRYRLLENSYQNDDETQLGLDWNVTPEFTLGFFRETSTRPIEPPPPGLIGIPTASPGHWNSGYLNWAPDPWTEIQLTIGSQRGGFRCAGGTCAQLPPFKGVRLTYYRVF